MNKREGRQGTGEEKGSQSGWNTMPREKYDAKMLQTQQELWAECYMETRS